ncbi:MAG: arylsulfotransferase family protein [Myxococcales bacterium]|nr:arylsulfotransferase family protein [Myxococcales bacterium]
MPEEQPRRSRREPANRSGPDRAGTRALRYGTLTLLALGAAGAVALLAAREDPARPAAPPVPPPRAESAPRGAIAATFSVPDAGPGRWHEFRTHRFDSRLSPEQRAEIERLEALGYVGGSRETDGPSRVTVHDPRRAYAGLNLATSGHGPEAFLLDMEGEVLHRWRHAFWDVWPEYPVARDAPPTQVWRRVHLYGNGDLLAIFEGLGLIKLDADSNLIWARPLRAHHDLEVMPDGRIYVLTREAHLVPRINEEEPVVEDFVSILDASGQELRRVSLLAALERSDFAREWRESGGRRGDLFHTNSLSVLDGSLERKTPGFRAGNILVSLLTLDMVAVVDLEQEKIVWARRGSFRRQHDPKRIANGNLLLFDNVGSRNASTVMELDPRTGALVWQYSGDPASPFLSRTCGTAERLPNGNTLITESDAGRAFEVTPEREIVWEFFNPHRAGERSQYIATLFEVVRLPADFDVSWARGSRAE